MSYILVNLFLSSKAVGRHLVFSQSLFNMDNRGRFPVHGTVLVQDANDQYHVVYNVLCFSKLIADALGQD